MKKLLSLVLILAIAGTTLAKKDRNTNNPIIGTWKYTNQSVINDFQQLNSKIKQDYKSENFIFESNHKFKHEFVTKAGLIIKTFQGKWTIMDDKIKISYADIDFKITINYFFIGTDLVLGQNFNHIIFSKADNLIERNLALK